MTKLFTIVNKTDKRTTVIEIRATSEMEAIHAARRSFKARNEDLGTLAIVRIDSLI